MFPSKNRTVQPEPSFKEINGNGFSEVKYSQRFCGECKEKSDLYWPARSAKIGDIAISI